MDHPRTVGLVRSAIATARADAPPLGSEHGTIPIRRYTDGARLARERECLFRRLPIPLAHASEVGEARRMLARELDGVSILVVRGDDGVVRGFRNACRHRGVRLLRGDCTAKAFVCPYHGWTYGIDGALVHVPHEAAFPSCVKAERGLAPVRVEERHGIVWAVLDEAAPDVRTHLGEIDDELASLGLATHVVGRRVVSEQRGNWKMPMEAFLESYHIRTLHRASVYPFFVDSRGFAERVGPHVRAATARRASREITHDESFAAQPLRELATPSWTIFPSTTLIAHPDWTSLVVVQPLATDRFLWSHTQLIPEAPQDDAARAHFERSFALIQGTVFAAEDLVMAAEMQAGIESTADEALTFGRLESPALWFHEAIDERLGP